jgi:hypothetical protein
MARGVTTLSTEIGEGRRELSEEKAVEKKVNLEGFAASVELPEGHQLVLGELPPGTIVEVATWQGTGRPDETTNRFLLSASGQGLQRRERTSGKTASTNEIEAPTTSELLAPVDANSISMGSIGAAGSRTSHRSFTNEAKQPVPQKRNLWKIYGQTLFTIISIIAITSLVLSLFGIGAVVPARGAKTALGPSTNALVIYKKSPSVEIGNPTVAILEGSLPKKYIFGPSNSFDQATIQIETTAGQELVPTKNVMGRAFLAIPLLGIIAKPFLR